MQSADVSALIEGLKDIIVKEGGDDYIKGDNDTFHLQKPSAWSMKTMGDALKGTDLTKTDDEPVDSDRILDYDRIVKHVLVHDDEYPSSKETVSFNHHAFYSNLKHYQSMSGIAGEFGRHLLYGEVVTSTNTMLEKLGSRGACHPSGSERN